MKTLSVLLTFFIATSAFQIDEQLTQSEVIRLAEQFIAENGYTNTQANKTKLRYELFDRYENNVDSILKHRHNTLQPKAFCISEDEDRWYIGFLSTKVDPNTLDSLQRQTDLPGRAVIVTKNGKDVRIAHKTPRFSFFEKLWL